MTHEEICTYEVAKLAKEKGFNGRTRYYYETNCINPKAIEHCSGSYYFNKYPKAVSAPTQSLLQRWLREEKKIYIAISVDIDHDLHRVCFEYGVCYDFDGRTMEYHNSYDSFGQYEDALEDALKWTLENLV